MINFSETNPKTVLAGKMLLMALKKPDIKDLNTIVFDEKLPSLLPELSVMFDVKERIEYHPEGTVGAHMKLAMQQAFIQTQDPVVRLAALLHDLGKAVTGGVRENPETGTLTPLEEGRHVGHDKLGVALIQQFFRKYDLPPEMEPVCLAVSHYHQRIHALTDKNHKPADIKVWLKLIDDMAVSPEDLARIALAGKIDARGRLGHEHCAYPEAELLQAIQSTITDFEANKPERERIKAEKNLQRENCVSCLKTEFSEIYPEMTAAQINTLAQQQATTNVNEWVAEAHPEWVGIPMTRDAACRKVLEAYVQSGVKNDLGM